MRHSLIAAGAMVALMGAGLHAQTTQSVTSSEQSACYVPGSGTVYRIRTASAPSQCSPGHVEFQLSTGSAKPINGPTGPAGGDLGGDYPNPVVVGIQGQPVSATAPLAGQVLGFSNGTWAPRNALPTTGSGAFDFTNPNGFVSVGIAGSGSLAVSGTGTRFLWYPNKRAVRAGGVTGTQWDAANIGDGSVAMGVDNRATAQFSTAMGYNNLASGNQSTAFGTLNVASGLASTALGTSSVASGEVAFAVGQSTVASGARSIAGGQNATASALGSISLGGYTTASGIAAIAMGSGAVASGAQAVAVGSYVTASGDYSTALGHSASTNGHYGTFVYGDESAISDLSAVADNQFAVRAQHFWFGTNNSATATSGRFIETSTGAYLTTTGVWTNVSDVNKKHDFKPVDGEQVLEKLAAMPVSTWRYNADTSDIRHMGPTAQDFRAAFGLGDTEKAIGTIDADGVSLAAIKALVQRTTELRAANAELRAELAEIQRRLAELQMSKP